MDEAMHPTYIRTLRARVKDDPALPLILETLDAWPPRVAATAPNAAIRAQR